MSDPYSFGPCTTWEPIWSCRVGDLTAEEVAVTGVALAAASEILYHLTAQRFDGCEITLRPCRSGCLDSSFLGTWWEYRTYPRPYRYDGAWYNLACGMCSGGCSCVAFDETTLPGVVSSVTQVKLNGTVLTPNVDYRLDDYRKLVRLNGLWPYCQNLLAADTEDDTWSVTAVFGEPLPVIGKMAVGELALEIVRYLTCSDECQLPNGVVDVSRQGISMTIQNVGELFNTGFINLRMCDLFIKTANPHHLQARSAIYNLDSPDFRIPGTA